MSFTFNKACAMLAAWNCHQSGVTIAEIARQAGRHPSTIRRWFKAAGFHNR